MAAVVRRAPQVLGVLGVAGALVGLGLLAPNHVTRSHVWPCVGIANLLLAFTLGGALESRRVALAALGLALGGLVRDLADPLTSGVDAWLDLLYFAIAFAAGLAVRARQRQVDHVAAAAVGQAEDAVAQERTRIARELHDVIAHGMSVTVVQADSARGGLEPDDHDTRAALVAIERTGRESLREMRRLLGLLHDDEEAPDAGLAPQPGVSDLPELARSGAQGGPAGRAAHRRRAGGSVAGRRFRRLPDRAGGADQRDAPRGVHAGDRPPRLRAPRPLRARDRRRPRSGAQRRRWLRSRHLGMRERARLYGGTLEAGPESDGFAVRARLPLDPLT